MNRLILLLVLVVAIPFVGNAQRKRAFLVGISDYRTNGYKVWNNIHGAEDIALLKPELEKKGFQIQALTNEQATYQGIVHFLDRFISASKKGDIIYLHFSCHGQPVEDGLKESSPKGEEADGWDESLVPIDAGMTYQANGYKGEKHITDDELSSYILQLRSKIGVQGMLYVAIDACHAGNMEREDYETTRGTNEGLTKNPQNKYNPSDMVKRSKAVHGTGLSPVLFVEACESNQRNQEIRYQGSEYGALSFNIWQMLNQTTSFPNTLQEFKSKLSNNISSNKNLHNRLWPGTQSAVFEY